jgi:hypothetical protein
MCLPTKLASTTSKSIYDHVQRDSILRVFCDDTGAAPTFWVFAALCAAAFGAVENSRIIVESLYEDIYKKGSFQGFMVLLGG